MQLQIPPPPPTSSSWLDLNWLVAIAAVAAAVGAFVANWIAHRQHRTAEVAQQRAEMSGQVSKEVEAKIGSVLLSLRSLEDDVRTRLIALTSTLDQKERELKGGIEEKEAALRLLVETSVGQAKAIEDVLQRASLLIPVVRAGELIPMHLLSEAESATDVTTKTGHLLRILEHPDSEASVLEMAGDRARALMNLSLAARLYKRSIEIDPDNISARAEFLQLMAYRSSERESARAQIIDLAKKHPNEENVVNCMLNFFIRIRDYSGLLETAMTLLTISRSKAMLWRNIAVARHHIDGPCPAVEEAYEQALALGDEGDYVNVARPYVRYLLTAGQLDKAERILTLAVAIQPSLGELHNLRGDLFRALGKYPDAIDSFQWAERLGDHADRMMARRRLQNLEILGQLQLTAQAPPVGAKELPLVVTEQPNQALHPADATMSGRG